MSEEEKSVTKNDQDNANQQGNDMGQTAIHVELGKRTFKETNMARDERAAVKALADMQDSEDAERANAGDVDYK